MTDEAKTTEDAGAELTKQVDALAKEISEGVAAIREARSTPAPAVQSRAPLTKEEMTKVADEKGVGEVLQNYSETVVGPVAMALVAQNARLRKELAASDPVLKKILNKYPKQVDEKIKALGLNDATLAERGYGDVIRAVAAELDPSLLMPEPAPEAKKPEPVVAPAPAPAAPAVVTPVESVYSGPVSAPPTPSKGVDEQIAEVKVEPREAKFMRDNFDMSEGEVKKQRYEIAKAYEKYGEDGIKRIGGVPVCSFGDMGLPEPRD